jgi:hypothetical protein
MFQRVDNYKLRVSSICSTGREPLNSYGGG